MSQGLLHLSLVEQDLGRPRNRRRHRRDYPVRHIHITMETLVATAKTWSLPKTRQVANSSGIEPENLKVFVLFANQLTGLEETRRRWQADGGTDLVRLLQEFSDRQASDDRDKVYGLLSLAKHDQKYIWPNYELDVFGTYRATALALIGRGGSLACWAGDQKRKFNKGLPSWIPDWSTTVENGDKRRMVLFDSYNVNCGWTLKVIENEKEYWTTVEGEMKLLMDSPASQARKLPASLNSFLLDYIDELLQRGQSLFPLKIDADELDRSGMDYLSWDLESGYTPQSTLKSLEWCMTHHIFPRSGPTLLQWWMRDVADPQNAIHLEQTSVPIKDWVKQGLIRQLLQKLSAAIEDENLDLERRMLKAWHAIEDIEAFFQVRKDYARSPGHKSSERRSYSFSWDNPKAIIVGQSDAFVLKI